MREYLDIAFEVIATGMEMIDACVEAHKELYGGGEDDPKSDHPATFGQSLHEEGEVINNGRHNSSR
jgi:hypothetical protein